MLVSAKEMLQKAKAGHYAVGQFNINNLEWTKAILLTAQENNSPVILGVSEGAGKYMTGYKTVVGMVNGMMEELNITVPVALHLDHGSYEGCLKCVEAGFSSIMYDGSHSNGFEDTEYKQETCDRRRRNKFSDFRKQFQKQNYTDHNHHDGRSNFSDHCITSGIPFLPYQYRWCDWSGGFGAGAACRCEHRKGYAGSASGAGH